MPGVIEKSEWLRAVLDFAFPPLCLGCQSYYEGDGGVCPHCLRSIDSYEHPLCLTCWNPIEHGTSCPVCREKSLPLFTYGNYVDPLKEIVISFKFRGITLPAGLFARLLAEEFGERMLTMKPDLLIPIPLHESREYYRGYNQAALLACQLEPVLDIRADSNRLVRIRKRKPQARLREAERVRNIRGVFRVIEPGKREKVFLVDDVVTSGATVREATSVLREAGYDVLGAIAIAHGR